MSGLFSSLSIAQSGLIAHQSAVGVASHNIANANTAGFSTRQVGYESFGSSTGMGVVANGGGRVEAAFLRQRTFKAHADAGYAQARSTELQRLTDVLAPPEGDPLQNSLDHFFDSAALLQGAPSNRANRESFLAASQSLASAFAARAQTIQDEKTVLNQRLNDTAQRATSLAAELNALNLQIASGTSPNAELADQRDRVATEVASLIGGQVLADEKGNVTVAAMGTTVVGANTALAVEYRQNATSGLGEIWVRTPSGESSNVTARANGGQLSALLSVRNNEIQTQQTELDQLAFDFANAANTIHASGYGLDGVSGRTLFQTTATANGAASAMSIAASVGSNPDAVAASASAAGIPGDNSIIRSLLGLQSAPVAAGGTLSVKDALRSSQVQLANRAELAAAEQESSEQQAMLADNLLISLTGVSSDEQLVQLQRYQAAYQASARVISTINQMLDTLVNL